ncbi:MAG: site-specific DNA-methyltransferase [Oscillospiraceae bacterium]|nr:site-specific DNA-methyltransferase [Oscillospiraceae bacterium]
MNDIELQHGDCLELMQSIPDGSIDLILCDLPYGTMKGAQLDGWKNQTTEWDVRLDTEILFNEYERILRENGTAVLFSQEPYTSELRNYKNTNLPFAYPLVWKKDHFANALVAKKAPVSYFEDMSVFYKKYDRQLLNPLRQYFNDVLRFIGCNSLKDVNRTLGHRRAEHSFYTDTIQFKLCTASTYQELIDRFHIDHMEGFKTFSECEKIVERFGRVFNLPEGQKFLGNVLEFKKDYQGLHPTQKPVALLEYLVKTYTNPGDLVLDNCMGSGSTGVACVNTGRRFIGMELDPQYFRIAEKRIQEAAEQRAIQA